MRIPIKVKNFVWRSFHNSIPSMINLWCHHVPVNGLCPVCQEEVETTDHALFQCSRAREVWNLLFPVFDGFLSPMDIRERWLSLVDIRGQDL